MLMHAPNFGMGETKRKVIVNKIKILNTQFPDETNILQIDEAKHTRTFLFPFSNLLF